MILDIFFVALLGLILGSFSSALSWRVPRGLPWAVHAGRAERSACPACHHRLSALDLVPLLSWLFLRGRCRYCRTAIGWRYPLIELACVGGCLAVYAAYGLTVSGGILMVAMPFFIAMIAIDWEYMILPDQMNLILAVLGGGFFLAHHGVQMSVAATAIAAALFYGGFAWGLERIMRWALRKEALGMGDIKFFAVAGLWLGFWSFPVFLILSGVFGVSVGLTFKIWKREVLFPFGPALVLSLLFCVLFLQQMPSFQGF